jgi:hypothetical protein
MLLAETQAEAPQHINVPPQERCKEAKPRRPVVNLTVENHGTRLSWDYNVKLVGEKHHHEFNHVSSAVAERSISLYFWPARTVATVDFGET